MGLLADLRYFGLHAGHYKTGLSTAEERTLTWGELEWHRGRLTAYMYVPPSPSPLPV